MEEKPQVETYSSVREVQKQPEEYSHSTHYSEVEEDRTPIYYKVGNVAATLVYIWTAIGISFLTLRIFLLMFGANEGASFANFVYRVSNDYMSPFRNLFESPTIDGNSYFDVSALFAIIVYSIFSWFVSSIIDYFHHKIAGYKYEQQINRQQRVMMAPQRPHVTSYQEEYTQQ